MQANISTPSPMPIPVFFTLGLFAIASGFVMSLLPLALKEHAMPNGLAAWLASVFYAGLLIGSTISARIVSHLKHRYALSLFLLAVVLSICAMAFFTVPSVWLIGRLVSGIAIAGVFVAIESWLLIADNEQARAKRLGLYMAALYGGSSLGQFGISLVGVQGKTPLLIAAAMIFLSIFPALLFRKSEPPELAHSRIKFNEFKNIPAAAYIGCTTSGLLIGAIYGLLPLELSKFFTEQQIGTMMAVVILGAMLIQPLISKFNARIEKRLLMAACSFCGLIAILIIKTATSIFTLTLLGLFLLGAAVFAIYPIAITLACKELDSTKIVSATELMQISYSVGSITGPIVAGYILLHAGSFILYLLFCLATTFLIMLYLTYCQKKKNPPAL
ncbi:MAG: MFS transporter [Enterovibrio sp.]